ncbi:hypothetical protein AB1484_27335 [Parafrankia sp. FMc6]|uniref:hypothetical protein n=1 Tax=Parafrankia soli TaxID=2599596 RepID=UPI0034D42363
MSARHARQPRVPVRPVAVSGLFLGAAISLAALLGDAGAGQRPVVHTVPAASAPAVQPDRLPAASRCDCPRVRVWDDGVEVPPAGPRVRVCALGSTCLGQDAGTVVDGPVTR